MIDRLTIRQPDDFHFHGREGEMLRAYVRAQARIYRRSVFMPNLELAVTTGALALLYRDAIMAVAPSDFEVIMTIKLTPQTTPEMIAEAAAAGVRAVKLYPDNVTTNSQGGVTDIRVCYPAIAEIERQGLLLLVHAELPGAFVMDRERRYLGTIMELYARFPALRIVVEHISTADGVECVRMAPSTVAATITAHHLVLTLDDIVGGSLNPHAFCKPVAKTPDDRAALIEAATSGSAKFFYGSDSAPHQRGKKECDCGAAGVYTAPVGLSVLAQVFEEMGALDRLEAFTSQFGAEFYGLPLNEGRRTLIRRPWLVPAEYDGVVPLFAGQTLDWQMLEAA